MKYLQRFLCSKWKYVSFGLLALFILDFFGVFTHFFELEFALSFSYPYDGDVSGFVEQLRKGETPSIPPINVYEYKFISNAEDKCQSNDNIRLTYLVKSSAANYDKRQAIRATWGYERRFSDVSIKTVFILGVVEDPDVLLAILHESDLYHDIVQVNFIDSYYNNTIKTVSALKWAVTYCPNSNYYVFSDDDMYVSTKNVLRFVRNPVEYPMYLDAAAKNEIVNVYNIDLPLNSVLYAGYVFNSSPLRHKSSKWYVSLNEYPYDSWPPYVTAGCYILSREALHRMYFTSMYTKHFRFDDIFLGLVAKKASIEPFHSTEFYFYHKPYSRDSYRYVVASHGFSNPHILVKAWNEQKSAGNA